MANTFKNKVYVNIGTVETSVYTVPANTTTTIIGLSIANTLGSAQTISVRVNDVSASLNAYLIRNAPLVAGSTLVLIGGDQKLVLEAGDILKFQASAGNTGDIVISMLETT